MTMLVAITCAEVRSVSALPAFLRLSMASAEAARGAEGNRGVRIKARTPLKWYTMTAWQDHDAMTEFVRGEAHRSAMRETARVTSSTGFQQLAIDGSLSDLSWRDAFGRLDGGRTEP